MPPKDEAPSKPESSRLDLSDELKPVPAAKELERTFLQDRGVWMMVSVLAVIGLLAIVLGIAWWATLPTLSQAGVLTEPLDAAVIETAVGTSPTPEQRAAAQELRKLLAPVQRLEAFTALRQLHLDSYRDFIQVLIVGILVPIFTLLAGYVFGAGEGKKKAQQG